MDKIQIEKNKGGVEYMEIDEFTRWMCLVEAFYFIEIAASERGEKDVSDRIKTAYIEKYIEERYPSIRHDIGVEYILGNI